MKCPYCEEALQRVDDLDFIYHCDNVFCEKTEDMGGTKELWQELIRTRKALDAALDWLEQVATLAKCDDDLCREFTKRKLTEIKTALEQKDK